MIDKALLDIFVCPKCHHGLQLKTKGAEGWLRCTACRVDYPIRDGIPVLLIDEAQPVRRARPKKRD